mgnify:CR=1 FL=1
MQRYFADYDSEHNRFIITGDDCRHIAKVMRMKEKEEILCVDKEQRTARCSIEKISNEEVWANCLQWIEESVELPIEVTIVSGLPKGDKLEWIIQKGTELGAARFIPFTAARSVVKWDEKKAEKKVSRWQKIAKEAAEQSHRTVIPKVLNPIPMRTLIEIGDQYDVKLIAYEEQAKQGENSILASALKYVEPGSRLIVVFGPEGGLTESEVRELEENGFQSCGLGARILRTETAPLYLLSAVSYHLELLG